MNTDHEPCPRRGRPISLNASETIALERPQAGEKIELIVKYGVIRIAANQSKNTENLTLAFACKVEEVFIITVKAGEITSSPARTPTASKAAWSVLVPELKAIPCLALNLRANSFSRLPVQLPSVALQDSDSKTCLIYLNSLPRINAQKMIMKTLEEDLKSKLHALEISIER